MIRSISICMIFLAMQLCGASLLSAQEKAPTIRVEMTTDTVVVGKAFKMRITVENHQGRIIPPELEALTMVGGPSQSSSYSLINGEMTQLAEYNFTLIAEKAGEFNLGPAISKGNDSQIATDDIILIVVPDNEDARGVDGEWIEMGSGGDAPKTKTDRKTRKF
jgi:hypothetical protein